MTDSEKIVYLAARAKWGEESQLIKLLEEMGELQRAIAKRLNGLCECKDGLPCDNFLEELVDVRIVLEQIEMMTGVGILQELKAKKLRGLWAKITGTDYVSNIKYVEKIVS